MKLPSRFRGVRGKRDKNLTPPTQPVPVQPIATKELTVQELEQVQGGRKAGSNPMEYLK